MKTIKSIIENITAVNEAVNTANKEINEKIMQAFFQDSVADARKILKGTGLGAAARNGKRYSIGVYNMADPNKHDIYIDFERDYDNWNIIRVENINAFRVKFNGEVISEPTMKFDWHSTERRNVLVPMNRRMPKMRDNTKIDYYGILTAKHYPTYSDAPSWIPYEYNDIERPNTRDSYNTDAEYQNYLQNELPAIQRKYKDWVNSEISNSLNPNLKELKNLKEKVSDKSHEISLTDISETKIDLIKNYNNRIKDLAEELYEELLLKAIATNYVENIRRKKQGLEKVSVLSDEINTNSLYDFGYPHFAYKGPDETALGLIIDYSAFMGAPYFGVVLLDARMHENSTSFYVSKAGERVGTIAEISGWLNDASRGDYPKISTHMMATLARFIAQSKGRK